MKIKRLNKAYKGIAAAVLCLVLIVSAVSPAFAATQINPVYTYTNGDYTFEKVSHPNSPLKSPDGIIDYNGQGKLSPYEEGKSKEGLGDRGQSYSYASATYGDWVYINTMYGGLGVANILKIGFAGMNPDTVKAMMDVMYNGNLYYGEPDGYQAGGVLLKFNVKTGETKILMSREKNGLIPTFRNACVMDGKMYFVGMVVDINTLTPQEVDKAIAMQDGQPCVYEIDPKTDKFKIVYRCVDMDGYKELVANRIFPSTRAIGVFDDCLVTGGVEKDGSFIAISKDPSKGQDSFVRIAEMDDLFNYPAIHRADVNAGGGIYQIVEYNGSLYAAVCAGTADTRNDKGTLRSFSIIRGDCKGDPTNPDSWTWTAVVGDKEKDGAKYTFGIDEERISAGACTLEVYDGYLYIGDYNDVSNALQNIALRKDFLTQSTNLQQSINLYRMDKDENIEMVVGDPTKMFPEGGISGLGSGYTSHMNQYTWQSVVYEGKLYVSTMDTTTLLRPLSELTNGNVLGMTKEDWIQQINYIRVMLDLMLKGTPKEDADNATDKNLTPEQQAKLTNDIKAGKFEEPTITKAQYNTLNRVNDILEKLAVLLDSKNHAEFLKLYNEAFNLSDKILDLLPDQIKSAYELILQVATKQNIESILKSVKYMTNAEAGFDIYEIEDHEDGSVTVKAVTTNGFGDPFNHGLRIFAKTTDYLLVGTANPFFGTQLWRRANTESVEPDTQVPADPDKKPDDQKPDDTKKPDAKPVDKDNKSQKDDIEVPNTGYAISFGALLAAGALGTGGMFASKKRNKKD